MKSDIPAKSQPDRSPTFAGVGCLALAAFVTYECIVYGGAYARGTWASWVQWLPLLLVLWAAGLTCTIYGIRRMLREMPLTTTLSSGETQPTGKGKPQAPNKQIQPIAGKPGSG